jgi:uncharacterized protein YeaO (DUF488 family)
MIQIRRAYDPPAADDGLRVLVDRLWPRGLTKDRAHIDVWLKDVAPSSGLRRWFGHDPSKWREFCRRYAGELKEKGDALGFLRSKGRGSTVTLLFGARDRAFNNAVALRDIIARRRGRLVGGAALAQGAARKPHRRPRRRRAAPARGVGRGDHRANSRRRS